MHRTTRTRRPSVIASIALAMMAPITASVAAPGADGAVRDSRDRRDPIVAVLDARVGQRVPNLTLPDLTGAPRSLTELRGQRAMLHVFASW
jgi:hypothetical protein